MEILLKLLIFNDATSLLIHSYFSFFKPRIAVITTSFMNFSTKTKIFDVISIIMSLSIIVSTIIITYSNYSPVPFWDDWDGSVRILINLINNDFNTFFQLHNEHFILIHKLIIYLDYKIFNKFTNFEIYINFFIIISIIYLFIRFIKKISISSIKQDYSLVFFIAGLFFLYIQENNLIIRFQINFWMGVLLPLLSFYFFAKYMESKNNSILLTSYVLGFLSLGAFAGTLFIVPIMTIVNFLFQKKVINKLYSIIPLVLVLVFYRCFYFGADNSDFSFSFFVTNLADFFLFILKYLGSPFYYLFGKNFLGIGNAFSIFFGLCYLMFVFWGLLHLIRDKNLDFFKLNLLLFSVYIIIIAVLIAYGRFEFGSDYAFSSRYTTFSISGWSSLIVCFYFLLDFARKKFVLAFSFILTFGVFSQIGKLFNTDYNVLYLKKTAGLASELGIKDSLYLSIIYPEIKIPLGYTKEAQMNNLQIFGKDIDGLYLEVGEIKDLSNFLTNYCKVNIDYVEDIPGEANYLRISGFLLNTTKKRVPEIIKFVNSENRIVGVAFSGKPRTDLKDFFGSQYFTSGFQGYILKGYSGKEISVTLDNYCFCDKKLNVPQILK